MSPSTPLWTPDPDRVAGTRLTAFTRHVASRIGRPLPLYANLHAASVNEPDAFWPVLWDFCGVIGDRGERVLERPREMPGARFFPDARLNFTENLLRRRDDRIAIVATSERGDERTLTWSGLADSVHRVAGALRASGVQPGDRVCGIVANIPEAIVAALGAAAIGAVWSSCSPDFGVQGIFDRFGQISPTVLLAVNGYDYAGKRHDVMAKLREVVPQFPTVRQVVVIPFGDEAADLGGIRGATRWADWLGSSTTGPQPFERFPFNHPLYILYSSGTTGVPKCIVHGAGGTLVQHLKEHQLHCDIRRDDRVFYFTTCGWMMWNWLVTVLASEATAVLYDGSPFHPSGARLFDLADRHGVTLFGISAKFIDAVNKAGLMPQKTHSLASIRTITSTGSPLSPESFDFVYRGIKSDVHLASISGGTDIVSCFVGGNPNAPVWRGEIQVPGLGMDVDVFDDDGRSLRGEPGELVCRKPFPSMPVGFWNDPGDGKYRAAYFERFPGIWHHGDWMSVTDHGGYVIYGRSDATLKPGGVRIGTAEIYRQVEQLEDVVESLAVGQEWQGDERIVLFVRLAPGRTLDAALQKLIADHIRKNASPKHVPARILQVADIPRTKSGKIVELAVRSVIHGREVKNLEALANPEALELFRARPELSNVGLGVLMQLEDGDRVVGILLRWSLVASLAISSVGPAASLSQVQRSPSSIRAFVGTTPDPNVGMGAWVIVLEPANKRGGVLVPPLMVGYARLSLGSGQSVEFETKPLFEKRCRFRGTLGTRILEGAISVETAPGDALLGEWRLKAAEILQGADARRDNSFSGRYSSKAYSAEGGDIVGMDVEFFVTAAGPAGVLVSYSGDLGEPVFSPLPLSKIEKKSSAVVEFEIQVLQEVLKYRLQLVRGGARLFRIGAEYTEGVPLKNARSFVEDTLKTTK